MFAEILLIEPIPSETLKSKMARNLRGVPCPFPKFVISKISILNFSWEFFLLQDIILNQINNLVELQ